MLATQIDAQMVRQFRLSSGLPLMECKRLLAEADGDPTKATQLARQQGLKPSDTPLVDRPGYVGIYRHHNGQMGAMVTLRCNSDTLAKTEEYRKLADSIAMHVAVADPHHVSARDVPDVVMRLYEQEVEADAKSKIDGKPEAIRTKILSGLLQAKLKLVCLMEQPFVRPDVDNKVTTVATLLENLSSRSLEPIEVESFHRFKI